MAKNITISLLKGTTAQNELYEGVAGEVTVDVESKNLRLHDGDVAGGSVIPSKAEVASMIDASVGDIEAALAAINGEI